MKAKRACVWIVVGAVSASAGRAQETAWKDGRFHLDTAGVVSRSDVVLARPNLESAEAMPLGNGTLGAAVWSADGMTVQLNREDAMPDRLSAGQVVIPGLKALTSAADYAGRLDLYHGEFVERGGGMTATAWVETEGDALVVEVTGADPKIEQRAVLKLWEPRKPKAWIDQTEGVLEEQWTDDGRPGASGRKFGSMAAVTAQGRDVTAAVTDQRTVTVRFKPDARGNFRVVVATWAIPFSPETLGPFLSIPTPGPHREWWKDFWGRAGLIKVTSKDGVGEYMENLRMLYLFVAAAERGDAWPGSQAGVGDMISAARDVHKWDPSAFWHWNLRMQLAANLGAGLPELNASYFNLYREDLPAIEEWTRTKMQGRPGVCVPETMRFNGPGIEYEGTWNPPVVGLNCDGGSRPYYNARTLTTGAEVGLWVWQQYLATGDNEFLAKNYPLMTEAARFLLAYQKAGADGMLHTSPANAHETQWDVTDPTTDLSAIHALYPAVMEAAQLLGKDADLVAQVRVALAKTPGLPRTEPAKPHVVLTESADVAGTDVIAESYEPNAEDHNVENIGLEPVWPFDLIGDESPEFALAKRTYAHRPSPAAVDWAFDPIQAARLDMGDEVGSTLVKLTEKFQNFVNGMAKWNSEDQEFYVEQTGVVAATLNEALVQDYDGVIRIAPAIPPGWDFDGSVAVRGKTKVDVQTRDGVAATVVIESGSAQKIQLRNPWQGQKVDVVEGLSGRAIVGGESGRVITFAADAGVKYIVRRSKRNGMEMKFAQVSGVPASSAKRLGTVQIGMFAAGEK
ncbi:MAG TPA: hypothetical protein VK716_06960 [Terracidiphilus sp.]|nr:hypothetical protein [Terracidiphilus sp.]